MKPTLEIIFQNNNPDCTVKPNFQTIPLSLCIVNLFTQFEHFPFQKINFIIIANDVDGENYELTGVDTKICNINCFIKCATLKEISQLNNFKLNEEISIFLQKGICILFDKVNIPTSGINSFFKSAIDTDFLSETLLLKRTKTKVKNEFVSVTIVNDCTRSKIIVNLWNKNTITNTVEIFRPRFLHPIILSRLFSKIEINEIGEIHIVDTENEIHFIVDFTSNSSKIEFNPKSNNIEELKEKLAWFSSSEKTTI